MSGGTGGAGHIWRQAALVWLALSALLAATIFGAYLPLGAWKLPVALLIAAAKAGLVAWIFMELSSATAIARLAALAGLLFAALLFALSFADEATRAHPPGTFPGPAASSVPPGA